MLSRVHRRKTLLISGSFWRESKSVIARSYASAAQVTMAFGPSLEEMRTSAKQSFYTTTAVSPLASPYLNPYGHPSPQPYPSNVMIDSYSEQTIGTSSVLCLVYLFSLTVYMCCLRKNSRCACLPCHCRFSTSAIQESFHNAFVFVCLDAVEINSDEYQNIEIVPDTTTVGPEESIAALKEQSTSAS